MSSRPRPIRPAVLVGLVAAVVALVGSPTIADVGRVGDSVQTAQASALRQVAANPDLSIPGFDVEAFAHPTTQKPAVLWFWNRVQTDEQVDQTLREMHAAGFTETVVFRRDAEQYFSEEWFDRVENLLRTSQELGMKVWLDNDERFPSGSAGGFVVNGGTVGSKTYEPRPDLRVKSALRAGSWAVPGGSQVDLGELTYSDLVIENGEVAADAQIFPGIWLLKAGSGWTDYEVTADFTIDRTIAGFMFRSPDTENGYLADVATDGRIDIWKQVDGRFTQLSRGTARPGFDPAAKHTITIRVDGPELNVSVDGVARPTVIDSTFASGSAGMRVDGAQAWRLDRMRVVGLPDHNELYASDYENESDLDDFDVVQKPLENVIAVTARPTSGPAGRDLDAVVDLTKEHASGQVWQAPKGDWRLEAFLFRYRQSEYIDSLDPEAQELYNHIIMDEYYERFPWAFGTVLQGFADDESVLGQRYLGAVPWSPALRNRLDRADADVARSMVALFGDYGRAGTAVAASYFRAASDQWVDAYWKPKYAWAEDHGVRLISNPLWDEFGPARVLAPSGNLLTLHQSAQLPGTDLIFDHVQNGAARLLPRTAASVAHQLGRPLVYDELMGATGWDRTLDHLREGAAMSALRGVNKALYHATYDEIEGIPFPPVFMTENTWWPWMNDVNTWTGRLMEFGRHTTAAPTALLQTQRANEALRRTPEGEQADRDWVDTIYSLEDSQIDFDLLDEGALTDDPQILAHAEVDDGGLKVGEMKYSAVVVPRTLYLSLEAATTLRDFVAAGGELVWAGQPPAMEIEGRDRQLAAMVHRIEALGPDRVIETDGPKGAGVAASRLAQAAVRLSRDEPAVRALRFQEGDTAGYLLLNEGDSPVTLDVTFPASGVPAIWDPETGEVTEATTYRTVDAGTVVPMTLQPRAPLGVTVSPAGADRAHATKVIGDGVVESLTVDDGTYTATVRTRQSGVTEVHATDGSRDLVGTTAPATVPAPIALDGDWTMQLENGSPPVTRPLATWTDLAPHYSGSATYTKRVTLDADDLTGVDWRLDLGQVADVAEVVVNGTEVGDRIWAPYELELSDVLREGENTIEVRVTNTMANEKTRRAHPSGLLGPVALRPSVTVQATLAPTG